MNFAVDSDDGPNIEVFDVGHCSWCSKPGADQKHTDVGGLVHWFHKKCWKLHCKWMKSPPPQKKK